MNYLEWSQEYIDTAEKLNEVITRLKAQKKRSSLSERKELDQKLAQYRASYGECMQIADLLKQRHMGIA